MKIAIIGSGISGLTAAHLLNSKHEIKVFEKNERLGGHTATKTVTRQGQEFNIDTGFIVYNDWTYPNFIKLLKRLNVDSIPTKMGFSVCEPSSGYEYAGNNINALFAQRSNLFNLRHIKMIRDILRFNREAISDYKSDKLKSEETLGNYLSANGYSDGFRDYYLLPMGAAIWSATLEDMLDFPVLFFVKFFFNHGLLSVKDRPTWRVIKGGSKTYIDPLIADFKDKIELNAVISQVKRSNEGIVIINHGVEEHFDNVIFACHSDEAVSLLGDDLTPAERDVVGAIKYRENDVVLHVDESLLPKRRTAWASWNYALTGNVGSPPILTYNMNILQSINHSETFCVTLNERENIKKDLILGEYKYSHPVFTQEAIQAQSRWEEVNGVNRTWFCGAYWHNGFHEDGVKSAVRVAEHLEGDTL